MICSWFLKIPNLKIKYWIDSRIGLTAVAAIGDVSAQNLLPQFTQPFFSNLLLLDGISLHFLLRNRAYKIFFWKNLSWSLEQFFFTVGQNNFGNKIPFLHLAIHFCFLETYKDTQTICAQNLYVYWIFCILPYISVS